MKSKNAITPIEYLRAILIDLPIRFALSVLAFTLLTPIGWIGIILALIRLFGVITWPWWVAALPLEYGVVCCVYMAIDGFFYRAGSENLRRKIESDIEERWGKRNGTRADREAK